MKTIITSITSLAIVCLMSVRVLAQAPEVESDKQQKADKLIADIGGTWTAVMTPEAQDSSKQETITFETDGRYTRKAKGNMLEQGSYRLNENHHILYLQPEGQDPVEWKVALKAEKLYLQKANADKKKRYVFVKGKSIGG